MCGRFQLAVELDRILERYGIICTDIGYNSQNEIFPSNMSPVIINDGRKKELTMLKWGFSVSFTKRLLINARSETVSSKSTFRDSFIHRRGLIPVSGYYEWKKENGKSIKYKIFSKEDIFSLACIYKAFEDNVGNKLEEYTILTCSANEDIKDIHERMPVIIDREYEDIWIDKKVRDISLLNDIIISSKKELLWEKV